MTRFKIAALCALSAFCLSAGDFTMHYSASAEAYGGPHDFAPYYMASMRHGTLTQARGAGLGVSAWRPLDTSRRFSYSFGIEANVQGANSTDYLRYNVANASWFSHAAAPSRVWLQQLWGEVKYRAVFLQAGLRDFTPALVNGRLSSGDLIESGNSRNIPGARAGFIDFQNIPFTKGWVQIQGELAYGKSTDNDWQKDRYNYYNRHLNLGWWYNYKRCFFRTKPDMPLSVTVGMQAAAQFAGQTWWYRRGEVWRYVDMKLKARDFLDMVVLREGDEYWKGNHVGSWDFQARYRLRNGSELKAYFQWLWEDGSGIGKLNGMDGLWGLEWKPARRGFISGAVLEFMTYMNQGGPIHYDYDDHEGTDLITDRSTGRDDYYNNNWYNGYALYGMSIGSPMFISPLYNTNGVTTTFTDNRFWGIHAAMEGDLSPTLSYRVMASYRRFFGTLQVPALHTSHDVSAMLETSWAMPSVPGLKINAQVAMDAGNSAYGNTFGALIGVSYNGIFNFKTGKSTPCVP